jgi:hypothetical protein
MKRYFLAIGLTALGLGGCTTSSDSGADGGDAAAVVMPTNIDCTKVENCYHLVCYDAPACTDVANPGGCAVGQVKDISGGACRACTAEDCDGLPGFCCGSDVCKNTVACGMFICKDIEASCSGVTSDTCGFHDWDDDDAWGDCDEAPSDPCCYCKVAVGCIDSTCGVGHYVSNGSCASCSGSTCEHPSCMGLNGCSTNCPSGQYYDGVRCRSCADSSSQEYIPACIAWLDAGSD